MRFLAFELSESYFRVDDCDFLSFIPSAPGERREEEVSTKLDTLCLKGIEGMSELGAMRVSFGVDLLKEALDELYEPFVHLYLDGEVTVKIFIRSVYECAFSHSIFDTYYLVPGLVLIPKVLCTGSPGDRLYFNLVGDMSLVKLYRWLPPVDRLFDPICLDECLRSLYEHVGLKRLRENVNFHPDGDNVRSISSLG